MSLICRLRGKSHGADGKKAAAEIERLRKLLAEAADDIEHWGSYADTYFQEKWKLAEDIKKYREAAERYLGFCDGATPIGKTDKKEGSLFFGRIRKTGYGAQRQSLGETDSEAGGLPARAQS